MKELTFVLNGHTVMLASIDPKAKHVNTLVTGQGQPQMCASSKADQQDPWQHGLDPWSTHKTQALPSAPQGPASAQNAKMVELERQMLQLQQKQETLATETSDKIAHVQNDLKTLSDQTRMQFSSFAQQIQSDMQNMNDGIRTTLADQLKHALAVQSEELVRAMRSNQEAEPEHKRPKSG